MFWRNKTACLIRISEVSGAPRAHRWGAQFGAPGAQSRSGLDVAETRATHAGAAVTQVTAAHAWFRWWP
ncbi:hypothetical protein GCM10009544_36890 [Streptomyces stramineus]|uniref:Uncharacterized protein n=1 Tax=Streptomyces stramineus TaxID=173861 RepID=A0ABN1AA64_9ACTN